jgi:hypothetical protein
MSNFSSPNLLPYTAPRDALLCLWVAYSHHQFEYHHRLWCVLDLTVLDGVCSLMCVVVTCGDGFPHHQTLNASPSNENIIKVMQGLIIALLGFVPSKSVFERVRPIGPRELPAPRLRAFGSRNLNRRSTSW